VQIIAPTPGFDSRTVQSVASRYTDWATRPTRQKWVLGIFSGGKDGRYLGLITLPLSYADCLETWEPQLRWNLWDCPGHNGTFLPSTLYRCHRYVSPICVIDVCHLYVSLICVTNMCHQYVSPICVTDMCHLYVSLICVTDMSPICVTYMCHLCVTDMCHLHVSPICVTDMCHRYVSPICVTYMCHRYVSPICHLYVSYVTLIVTHNMQWYNPLYRRLGGPQGRSERVRKISTPLGFDPRTVQPVASRYTNWVTGPTIMKYIFLKLSLVVIATVGPVAQSVDRIATGFTVRGS
jgi:hypothetical protein